MIPRNAICFLLCFSVLPSLGGPLSPVESLDAFDLESGFTIEVFASEPDVIDPVAMTFDEYGRVYVAEMRELEQIPALEPGTKSTIRLLEDTDEDGKIDRSVLFAEHVSFPSGLVPYRGGVFALCTPDLLYLKDTDGDGRADVREIVLTGFAQGNAEHRFNNLKWHFDNWIYAANGHAGGNVYFPETPEKKTDLSGRDMRFSPFLHEVEAVSRGLPGGFGNTFDDWGRRYICHNERHVMNVVLPARYLRRNLDLPVRTTGEDISDHGQPDAKVYPISAPQQWRIERTQRRAREQADRFRETQLQANGYFTAACGVTVYRADLFPEPFRGNLFVCDAAQNLVHRDILSENGISMVASRGDDGREFLRSTDQWFRPVNLFSGPDGALYVIDSYREIIETAASIPDDILAKIDLRAGSDRGRIYRIVPSGDGETSFRVEKLGSKSDTELLPYLGHPNAWYRLTAQRLLIERNARSVVPELENTALHSEDPLERLHALWTLAGLDSLREEIVSEALEDPHPRIREQALRLSEAFLATRGES